MAWLKLTFVDSLLRWEFVRLKTSSRKPAIRAHTLALPDPHEWNKRHRHDDLPHCDV